VIDAGPLAVTAARRLPKLGYGICPYG